MTAACAWSPDQAALHATPRHASPRLLRPQVAGALGSASTVPGTPLNGRRLASCSTASRQPAAVGHVGLQHSCYLQLGESSGAATWSRPSVAPSVAAAPRRTSPLPEELSKELMPLSNANGLSAERPSSATIPLPNATQISAIRPSSPPCVPRRTSPSPDELSKELMPLPNANGLSAERSSSPTIPLPNATQISARRPSSPPCVGLARGYSMPVLPSLGSSPRAASSSVAASSSSSYSRNPPNLPLRAAASSAPYVLTAGSGSLSVPARACPPSPCVRRLREPGLTAASADSASTEVHAEVPSALRQQQCATSQRSLVEKEMLASPSANLLEGKRPSSSCRFESPRELHTVESPGRLETPRELHTLECPGRFESPGRLGTPPRIESSGRLESPVAPIRSLSMPSSFFQRDWQQEDVIEEESDEDVMEENFCAGLLSLRDWMREAPAREDVSLDAKEQSKENPDLSCSVMTPLTSARWTQSSDSESEGPTEAPSAESKDQLQGEKRETVATPAAKEEEGAEQEQEQEQRWLTEAKECVEHDLTAKIQELRSLLEATKLIRDIFEKQGRSDLLDDPASLQFFLEALQGESLNDLDMLPFNRKCSKESTVGTSSTDTTFDLHSSSECEVYSCEAGETGATSDASHGTSPECALGGSLGTSQETPGSSSPLLSFVKGTTLVCNVPAREPQAEKEVESLRTKVSSLEEQVAELTAWRAMTHCVQQWSCAANAVANKQAELTSERSKVFALEEQLPELKKQLPSASTTTTTSSFHFPQVQTALAKTAPQPEAPAPQGQRRSRSARSASRARSRSASRARSARAAAAEVQLGVIVPTPLASIVPSTSEGASVGNNCAEHQLGVIVPTPLPSLVQEAIKKFDESVLEVQNSTRRGQELDASVLELPSDADARHQILCDADPDSMVTRGNAIRLKQETNDGSHETPSSPQETNDEGVPVDFGSARHGCEAKHYCGRYFGQHAIPGSNGRCGPTNGPQCASCRRFQKKQAKGSRKAADDASKAAGKWKAKASPRRWSPAKSSSSPRRPSPAAVQRASRDVENPPAATRLACRAWFPRSPEISPRSLAGV